MAANADESSTRRREHVADTIAELVELNRTVAPWLYPVEWQTEPDPDMFGRLLVELGQLWQKLRPDPNPGSRYQLAASVVNLTGTRTSLPASWEFTLPGPDGTACILRVRERYLAEESASETLERVARGEIGRCILPLIVLMHGAGEPDIIQRWLEVAGQEPDPRRRALLASLTLVLADLEDWQPLWETALQEWNVRESPTVLRWKREGVAEYLQEKLKRRLEKLFGALPREQVERIDAILDPERLDKAIDQLDTLTRIEDLSL